MRLGRNSVALTVIISLVTVTTLVLGVFGAGNYATEKARRWEKLHLVLTIAADQLSAALALPVWNIDREQINKVIESMMKNHDVYGIVVDAAGKKHLRVRNAEWNVIEADIDFSANGLLAEERNVAYLNETIGTVRIYVTTQFAEGEMRGMLVSIMSAIFIVDCILTLTLYLLLWRIVLKPLKEVEEYAGAVSSEAPGRVPARRTKSRGELERLRSSIEKMVGLLQSRNDDLQEKVRQRRESEERFSKAFNLGPVRMGIIRIKDGVILDVNDRWVQDIGFAREEIIGHPIFELGGWLGEDQRNRVRRMLDEGTAVHEVEAHLTTKAGEQGTVLMSAEVVELGGETCFLWASIDITQREHVEKQLHATNEQLRALAQHLESIREDERARIAREIHDELGQLLTALKMDVSFVKDMISDQRQKDERPGIKTKLATMSGLIDETIQFVRRIGAELRPVILDSLGISAAIEWQIEEFEKRSKIRCRSSLPPGEIRLDPLQSTTLYRVFQESLTNITRHSGASEVEINLRQDGGQTQLEIKDNGTGIREDDMRKVNSFGILGMKERAAILGGTVEILNNPGGGTIVRVIIPNHSPPVVVTS